MARKLNRINLEKGAACMHCDHEFEPPYERMPEIESPGTRVLVCPECGNYTVFVEDEKP